MLKIEDRGLSAQTIYRVDPVTGRGQPHRWLVVPNERQSATRLQERRDAIGGPHSPAGLLTEPPGRSGVIIGPLGLAGSARRRQGAIDGLPGQSPSPIGPWRARSRHIRPIGVPGRGVDTCVAWQCTAAIPHRRVGRATVRGTLGASAQRRIQRPPGASPRPHRGAPTGAGMAPRVARIVVTDGAARRCTNCRCGATSCGRRCSVLSPVLRAATCALALTSLTLMTVATPSRKKRMSCGDTVALYPGTPQNMPW